MFGRKPKGMNPENGIAHVSMVMMLLEYGMQAEWPLPFEDCLTTTPPLFPGTAEPAQV